MSYQIRFRTPKNTVAIGECEGLYEARYETHPLHYRKEQDEPCKICGAMFGIWTDRETYHGTHLYHCR